MERKYLPLDVSSFDLMISNNYLYIDKTKYIYDLFSKGGRYYFLSRPRRFGKSLLISTLKELFSCNKKLFENFWISKSNFEWKEHPVIHLDFSNIPHFTAQELRTSLNKELKTIANNYNIVIDEDLPEETLKKLVFELSKKNRVVILVDEYDKPILDHLKNTDQANEQRDVLKSFYDVLKGLDKYLKAIFVTGVTKFAKTSLFSGLNNLNDISMDPIAAQLLGYTQEEIENNFQLYLADFAEKDGKTITQLISELKKWYNGYRFSESNVYIYNPFSVLYALNKQKFLNYWYQSGTPTFLIHLIIKQYKSIEVLNQIELDQDSLSCFTIDDAPLIPLLFQTGYLTISNYDIGTGKFKLDFPNYEVQLSFTKFFVATLAETSKITLDTLAAQLKEALKNNDIERFCKVLETLFAHIPYTLINREDYYHILFQFLLSLLSLESQSEVITNKGRIDLILSIAGYIYIFELKLNKTPEAAIEQIKERGYYERFLHQGKKIVLVGLSFIPKNNKVHLHCLQESI